MQSATYLSHAFRSLRASEMVAQAVGPLGNQVFRGDSSLREITVFQTKKDHRYGTSEFSHEETKSKQFWLWGKLANSQDEITVETEPHVLSQLQCTYSNILDGGCLKWIEMVA